MKNLASTYRPKNIRQLHGQKHIKLALSNLLKDFNRCGELPRSLIVTGPWGTGKTTISRMLLRYIACAKGPLAACNECESCKALDRDQNPDYFEIDAASHNGVDDVGLFQEWASFKTRYKRRFLVLDEAHRLSKQAWDCLLKFLEDSTQNTTFVFCTTERDKIPSTIISRSTELKLLKIRPEDLVLLGKEVASQESITFESEEGLLNLVRRADGHARDLLKFIEQAELYGIEDPVRGRYITNDAIFTMLEIYDLKAAKDTIRAIFNRDKKQIVDAVKEKSTTASYFVVSLLELLRHELFSRSLLQTETEFKEASLESVIRLCGLLEECLGRLNLGESLSTLYIAYERWVQGESA